MTRPLGAKLRLSLAEQQGQRAAAEPLIQGTSLVRKERFLADFGDMGACDDFLCAFGQPSSTGTGGVMAAAAMDAAAQHAGPLIALVLSADGLVREAAPGVGRAPEIHHQCRNGARRSGCLKIVPTCNLHSG